MNKLEQLHELRQSVWLDYIRRSFILNGELRSLVESGIKGVTSNPSIFEKAIAHNNDYDQQLFKLVGSGTSVDDIYETLVVDDIRMAADILHPVYIQTGKVDGYVSLEVNPFLANDTKATLEEAIRLWKLVERPNLMIKIPATKAGLPAIREAIIAGININVTLIFSIPRYKEVLEAYMQGLENRLDANQPIDHIHSVASFFISRLDSKIDPLLLDLEEQSKANLMGMAAIANARLAYKVFLEALIRDRFQHLQKAGAGLQRPLWASTSTKNPDYSDIIYVQELIAPDTVNTIPQNTLMAFIDHGIVERTIPEDTKSEEKYFERLSELGIDLDKITLELELEGVEQFASAYRSLMESLERKCNLIKNG